MGTKNLNSATDLITFTRASSSTFLGSNGLIQTATNNTPRIEYNADGTVKGLLIEEARTNTFRYSEELSNVKTQLNVTDNSTTAPDGQLTADLCVPSNITTEHFLDDQQVTVGTSYAVSFFGKYHSGNYIMGFRGGGIGSGYPRFNLETGTIVNEGSNANWTDTKIEDVGNGWYRCSSVGTPTNNTAWRIQFCDGEAGLTTGFSGDGTGHYIWGVQAEADTFPTSYIPTTGSTATRAADNASIPVDNFGYNDDAGTVVVNGVSSHKDGDSGVFYLYENNSNFMGAKFSNHNRPNSIQTRVVGSGGDNAQLYPTPALANTSVNYAVGFATNNVSAVIDGGTIESDTDVDLFAVSQMSIGYRGPYNDLRLNGHIKSIKYYPRRLTDTQLQELTT